MIDLLWREIELIVSRRARYIKEALLKKYSTEIRIFAYPSQQSGKKNYPFKTRC